MQKELSVPVFNDDQHGTAIITLAALLNALKLVKKELSDVKIVIAGAGFAGYEIFKLLRTAGANNIFVTDSKGALNKNRIEYDEKKDKFFVNNRFKKEIDNETNPLKISGSLANVLKGSDVFIGVSGKGQLIEKDMIKSMNQDPLIFALTVM